MSKYTPRSPFYDRMPFGKHRGRYLCDIALHETAWLVWAKEKRVLQSVFYAVELARLFERISSIKVPPAQDPSEKRVVDYHYDKRRPLSDVRVRRESDDQSDHTDIVKTLSILDIAFSRNHRKTIYHNAYGPVVDAIYREYFPGHSGAVSDDEAIAFFTTEANFLRGD